MYDKRQADFFICRNLSCDPKGCYFGLNTDWIKTIGDGRQFACPICGEFYRPGSVKEHDGKWGQGKLPAHKVWVLRDRDDTEHHLLAEWAPSAEENMNVRLKERDHKEITQELERLSHEQLSHCLLYTSDAADDLL